MSSKPTLPTVWGSGKYTLMWQKKSKEHLVNPAYNNKALQASLQVTGKAPLVVIPSKETHSILKNFRNNNNTRPST